MLSTLLICRSEPSLQLSNWVCLNIKKKNETMQTLKENKLRVSVNEKKN